MLFPPTSDLLISIIHYISKIVYLFYVYVFAPYGELVYIFNTDKSGHFLVDFLP